jgi:hypothetical protein
MNDLARQQSRLRATVGLASMVIALVAILNALFALFAHWSINAEALGKHDLGLAIALSFAGGGSLIAAYIAVPVLALMALLSAFQNRRASVWLMIAALVSAVPLLVL